MDAAEVVDQDTLNDYLRTLPKAEQLDVRRRVAFRAAARVLPIAAQEFLTSDWARKDDLTPVAIFGAAAISAVGDKIPTADIGRSAVTAADVAADAADAAFAAYAAAFAFASATAALATAASNASAEVWDTDLWALIRRDLTSDSGIWPEGMPKQVADTWAEAQAAMADHPANWDIWIHWYNRILQDRDWHPQAMWKVLQNITRDDWDKGPTHINPMFDEVLGLYVEEDAAPSPLSQAYPFDFTFDTLHRVMRMIGIDDNMRHLRDPAIVQAFLDDAEQLRDDFVDFTDYANELAVGGNYAGVLRRAAEKVIKEFDRVEEHTHLRAERLVLLGSELEAFAISEQGRADLGVPLSGMLDTRIDNLKRLCREHFGPSYQTLAPLAELNLDFVDQESVVNVFDEAIAFVEVLPSDDFLPLEYEGQLVLKDMLGELRNYRAAIAEASTDEFRAFLEDRFAQSAGSLGLSLLRFGQRSKDTVSQAGRSADVAIKTSKRIEGLADILQAIRELFSVSGA